MTTSSHDTNDDTGQPPSAPSPAAAEQWLERIVHALIMGGDTQVLMEGSGPDGAILRVPRAGSRALLLRYTPGRDQAIAERLRQTVRELRRQPLEVALIGGPPEVSELLARALPRYTRKPVSMYHLRDDGTTWERRSRLQPGTPLRQHLTVPRAPWPLPEDERARFVATLRDHEQAMRQEREEMGSFSAALHGRRPVATWTLAAVIIAVFVLQMLWGALDSTPALVRMGALVPERIRDGEWWRLISCTFLHGSVAHLAFNTFVLVMLGSVLERILGTSRFLVLYGAAALAGSLASFLAGDARISVGASGALWGLLIADAVLAFRPRGLLPAAVIQQAKRAAMINLVINVANSFRPQVDMAAHFGGGAVGALLLGTGLLTLGLRPLGRAASAEAHLDEDGDRDEDEDAGTDAGAGAGGDAGDETGAGTETGAELGPRTPRALIAGAAAVVLVLAAGLALGLLQGRPWELDQPPAFATRDIPALGLRAELPAQLAPQPVEVDGDLRAAVFGDLYADPVMIELVRIPLDAPITGAQLDAELDQLATALADPPEGGQVLEAPARVELAPRPGLRVIYELPNGLILERGVAVAEDHILRVDVAMWPGYRDAHAGLAARILGSLAPGP